MKILFAGDIVGGVGRETFAKVVRELKAANEAHIVVANAENSAGGSGITLAIAEELKKSGADVITLGDHTWGQKETESTIEKMKIVIRPANYPEELPGAGWIQIQTAYGPIIVINLQGQVFMASVDNPFRKIDALLKSLPRNVPIFVDFHAEATSEKIAMGYFLDGRVAGVVGTHTHVQTSDAKILPQGTAYITDLGMTGADYSVLGRSVTDVLKKFKTGMPVRLEVAKAPGKLEGAIIDFDREAGKVKSINAYRRIWTS